MRHKQRQDFLCCELDLLNSNSQVEIDWKGHNEQVLLTRSFPLPLMDNLETSGISRLDDISCDTNRKTLCAG